MAQGSPPSDHGQATLSRGASIGRYVVLGLVGRGGMGEVYAAYDPELDRKVAVKLLRVKPGNGVSLVEGRQRTLREAQAIARLSHPNVVVVYDVGTFKDQVFIAMEYVEGNTVTYWVQSQARSWQEILKVFMAAGRGLSAAHDKGLVHRDFKPDNVMVGAASQVRVMDFGLARQLNEKGEGGSPRRRSDSRAPVLRADNTPIAEAGEQATLVLNSISAEPSGPIDSPGRADMLEAHLTRTGAMMGTPAYMAPEQFLGTGTDARTDQFSFCVALYEALYGQRPFGGNTMYALTNNVVQGKVREPPANVKVPAWLRKVVLRGLRPIAAERYPSMAELIEAMGKNPTVQRRRIAMAVAAVVALSGVGIGVKRSAAEHKAFCSGGPAKLAEVWEVEPNADRRVPRQEQIRKAFMKSGKSYAADVFATVSRSLSKYAQSWAGMYKEACEATQVRGEQSGEVLDLRMSCLNERLGGFKALADVFSSANGEVVENAVNAANTLGSLDRCADVPLLRAVVRPPEDPATRRRVEDLRARLADLKALFNAGRYVDAGQSAPRLVAEARSVGYQPLLAEALMLWGTILYKSDDAPASERAYAESYRVADASRHDEVRAEDAVSLVFVVGFLQGRPAEARMWAKMAEAVLQRLGGHQLLRAWLLNDLGTAYYTEGQKEAAVRVMQESVSLKAKALGEDHPDVGVSEGNLAAALAGLGRIQEALEHITRSVNLLERGVGAEHPDLAIQLCNYGEILNEMKRHRDARQAFERARAIWERELGPNKRSLGDALTGIGTSYVAEGNAAAAVAPLERALKILAVAGTDKTKLAETRFALARALWNTGRDRARAIALGEDARSEYANSAAKEKLLNVESWLAASAPTEKRRLP